MKKFIKRLLIFTAVILLLAFGLYLARKPILRGVGNFLISEDVSEEVDAAFILSGGARERTRIANDIYPLYTPLIITMGKNESNDLAAMGIKMKDAEIARKAILDLGIDSANVRMIPQGTSTYEEAQEILGYSNAEGFKRIMVVSSAFHTRRVRNVFDKGFREAGIEVVIKGVPPLEYDTDSWWNNESGMIFVFNEYAKLLYYSWKY